MKLSVGIVGLPNVGKSTLFKALTKQEVNIANYPFATIDPNVGVVAVPDERLEKLARISNSRKVIPAVVEFYDIAGLVKGAHQGEGLGNQFLSHIRETQAIAIVIRLFRNSDIVHIEETVDPLRDFEIILIELVFKDLETVGRRLEGLEKETKSGDKKALRGLEILRQVRDELDAGRPALKFREEEIIRELNLLTAKKQIYFLNGEEKDVPAELLEKIRKLGADYLVADLAKADSVPALIQKTYALLDLISFFTTGEDETRAWTVKRGVKAPQAAGAIHSDFEKNFIRAEVVRWDKLLEAASWQRAKEKGLIRTEGRDYVVQDGDVVLVRHG